jgi:AcrR family transcriptional regulator
LYGGVQGGLLSRPLGAKNTTHQKRRRALAAAVFPRLLADGGRTSLNELAVAADASVPTIKHYFKDRSGLVAASLREQLESGKIHLARTSDPGPEPIAQSLEAFATELINAWINFGVGKIFVVGIGLGVYDPQAGPGYLDGILEPTIQALEQRMRVYASRKELAFIDEEDVRIASLAYLSPLIVALIHQNALSGTTCRPLDLHSFAKRHTEQFLRAWKPESSRQ